MSQDPIRPEHHIIKSKPKLKPHSIIDIIYPNRKDRALTKCPCKSKDRHQTWRNSNPTTFAMAKATAYYQYCISNTKYSEMHIDEKDSVAICTVLRGKSLADFVLEMVMKWCHNCRKRHIAIGTYSICTNRDAWLQMPHIAVFFCTRTIHLSQQIHLCNQQIDFLINQTNIQQTSLSKSHTIIRELSQRLYDLHQKYNSSNKINELMIENNSLKSELTRIKLDNNKLSNWLNTALSSLIETAPSINSINFENIHGNINQTNIDLISNIHLNKSLPIENNIDEKLHILNDRNPCDIGDYLHDKDLLYRARQHSLDIQLSNITSKLRFNDKHLKYIRGNTNDGFIILTNTSNRYNYKVSFKMISNSRFTTNIMIYFNLSQQRNSIYKSPPSINNNYKIQSCKSTTKTKKSQRKKNSKKNVPRRRYASIVKDANRPEGQTKNS